MMRGLVKLKGAGEGLRGGGGRLSFHSGVANLSCKIIVQEVVIVTDKLVSN
jgi:hypothetical protein